MSILISSSGTALQKVLITALVLTLVGVGVFSYTVVGKMFEEREDSAKEARRVAEFGLQEAFQKLKLQPSWRENLPKTDYGEGSYKVNLIDKGANAVELEAVGTVNGTKRSIKCLIEIMKDDSGNVNFENRNWEEY